MNCHQIRRAIHAQLEDQPIRISEELLNEHLAKCSRCREEAAQLRQLTDQLHTSRVSLQAPVEMVDQIWMSIQEQKIQEFEAKRSRVSWFNWRYSLVGTAAAMAALLVGSFAWQPAGPGIAKNHLKNSDHTVALRPTAPNMNRSKPSHQPKVEIKQSPSRDGQIKQETKPSIRPRNLRKIRRIYYAQKSEPQVHQIAGLNATPGRVINSIAKKAVPEQVDYERVAQTLRSTQMIESQANAQVQMELEKTARLLGQAMELIQGNAVKDSASKASNG
jgi:hypothetical protein